MIRILGIAIVTMFICATSVLAHDAAVVKATVQKWADALNQDDFDTIVNMYYPPVMTKLGNKEDVIDYMAGATYQNRQAGLESVKVTVSDPTQIKQDPETKITYAMVPVQFDEIQKDGSIYRSKEGILVVSKNGKEWFIVDHVADFTPNELIAYLPGVSNLIDIIEPTSEHIIKP